MHVCHDVFQKLLSLTWDARNTPTLRTPLYTALLQYLVLSRPPALARLPPAALQGAVTEGGPRTGGAPGVAALLDDVQRRLEAGNAALLLAGARLLEVVGRDAVCMDPMDAPRCVLALQVLGEMVAAEASGALADVLHGSGLPVRLLQDLADTPRVLLLEVRVCVCVVVVGCVCVEWGEDIRIYTYTYMHIHVYLNFHINTPHPPTHSLTTPLLLLNYKP